MVIEFEVISQLPLAETGKSIARYVPMRVFQKKLFELDKLQIEEHVNSKGIVVKKFTTAKYDNEFYKINKPYNEIRDEYFLPLTIKGLTK
jgi:hypothetical protein